MPAPIAQRADLLEKCGHDAKDGSGDACSRVLKSFSGLRCVPRQRPALACTGWCTDQQNRQRISSRREDYNVHSKRCPSDGWLHLDERAITHVARISNNSSPKSRAYRTLRVKIVTECFEVTSHSDRVIYGIRCAPSTDDVADCARARPRDAPTMTRRFAPLSKCPPPSLPSEDDRSSMPAKVTESPYPLVQATLYDAVPHHMGRLTG